MCPLLITGSERARESGTLHTTIYSRQCADKGSQQMLADHPHLLTFLDKKVWLSTRDIRLRLPCRKLSPRFVGPFTILEQVNPVTYKLQLPAQYKIHPTFHVSLLNHIVLLFPQSLAWSRNPLFLSSLMKAPSTEFMRSWIPGVVVGDWNIWSTGRATVPRSAHGSPGMIFWTLFYWRNFMPAILIVLLLEDEADHPTPGSALRSGPWRGGYCHRMARLFLESITTIHLTWILITRTCTSSPLQSPLS